MGARCADGRWGWTGKNRPIKKKIKRTSLPFFYWFTRTPVLTGFYRQSIKKKYRIPKLGSKRRWTATGVDWFTARHCRRCDRYRCSLLNLVLFFVPPPPAPGCCCSRRHSPDPIRRPWLLSWTISAKPTTEYGHSEVSVSFLFFGFGGKAKKKC